MVALVRLIETVTKWVLIFDHGPKKMWPFVADFQYGFRSSRSTADLLTDVSDRITWAFNRSGATQAVALDISKSFYRD